MWAYGTECSGIPVVEGHVQGVIDEVADGEGDECVAGGREGGDQVVLHLWGLGVGGGGRLGISARDALG